MKLYIAKKWYVTKKENHAKTSKKIFTHHLNRQIIFRPVLECHIQNIK